ncbi:MAG: hypothetical protein ACHP84_01195 [Caulobacterales bacterium]
MFARIPPSALAVVYLGLIALALVWPQGQGAPSPHPFGHPVPPMARQVTVEGRPVDIRGPETSTSDPAASSKPVPRS